MSVQGAGATNNEILELLRKDQSEIDVQRLIDDYRGHDFGLVERAAYYGHKGYKVLIEATPEDLDQAAETLKAISHNPKVSQAGYASINPGQFDTDDSVPTNTPVWLLWLLITQGADTHWSFIIPATLNMIDSVDIPIKTEGARLAQLLARTHHGRLVSSGLVSVFEEALNVLLSYLPPSIEPAEATKINSATLDALLELATTRQRYNYLMIKALAALEHSKGDVDFTYGVVLNITRIVQKMQLLAVAHLQSLVNVFMAISCDPFADMSPKLLNAAAELMLITMEHCSPRVAPYRYSILMGVVKGKLWDHPLTKELEKYVSSEEISEVRSTPSTSRTPVDT